MLGQPASWHTVCSPSDFTRLCRAVYCGPMRARVLIHSGLRSIGVSALRTSRRSSFLPSGTGEGVTSTHITPRGQRVRWTGVDPGAIDFERDYYPAMAEHYRVQRDAVRE